MRSACRRKSTTALGTACLLVDASRHWHSECMNALSTAVDSGSERVKGEVKAKIKISPVVVFGVLSRMVVVRGS